MRIGFDAKRAFFNKSGLGSYSRNLIQGLAEKYPENEYLLYTPGLILICLNPTRIVITLRNPERLFHRIFRSYWRSHYFSHQLIKRQN